MVSVGKDTGIQALKNLLLDNGFDLDPKHTIPLPRHKYWLYFSWC